jgi:hypothetical protein
MRSTTDRSFSESFPVFWKKHPDLRLQLGNWSLCPAGELPGDNGECIAKK